MHDDRCDPPSVGDVWVVGKDRRKVISVHYPKNDPDDAYVVVVAGGLQFVRAVWVAWASKAQLELLE